MSSQNVQDHYSGKDTGSGMASRILAALRSVNGNDAAVTPEALEPLGHFNARGVAATQELVALPEPQAGETVLDVGSIGGPARWIAMRWPHRDRRRYYGGVLRCGTRAERRVRHDRSSADIRGQRDCVATALGGSLRRQLLATDDETRHDLFAAGFEVLTFRETTQENLYA